MVYRNVEEMLLKLVSKKESPRCFIFHGKNFSEIEKISNEMCLKIFGNENFNLRDKVEFKNFKKTISVSDIRELNIEISKKPEICENKVILIYDSQKMSEEAQNAFLKTLEDCHRNVFIIMLCTNINNILNTIISRCVVIKFKTMEFEEFCVCFENENLDETHLMDLYIQTKGDVHKARSFIKGEFLYELYNFIFKIIEYIISGELLDIFDLVNEISNYKNNIDLFINGFFEIVRDLIVYSSTSNDEFIENRIFKNCILDLSFKINKRILNKIIVELTSFKNKIGMNINLENSCKIMILKIKEE